MDLRRFYAKLITYLHRARAEHWDILLHVAFFPYFEYRAIYTRETRFIVYHNTSMI